MTTVSIDVKVRKPDGAGLNGVAIGAEDLNGTALVVAGTSTTAGTGGNAGKASLQVTKNPGESFHLVFPADATDSSGRQLVRRKSLKVRCFVPATAAASFKISGLTINYEWASCQVTGTVSRQTDPQDPAVVLPFAGVAVMLLEANESQLDQLNTDSDGNFCFYTDSSGPLTVRFPANLTVGDQLLNVVGNSDIELYPQPGYSFVVGDVVYAFAACQIIGQVSDGKKGLSGATTQLIDVSTGQAPAGASAQMPASTDATGFFQFQTVPPGKYLLNFPRTVQSNGRSWELQPGQTGSQSITVAAGEVKMTDPVSYQPEEHKIVWTVTSSGMPTPGILVQVFSEGDDEDDVDLVAQGRTGQDGRVALLVDEPGDYQIRVYSDDRAAGGAFKRKVSVHSTVTGSTEVASPSAGSQGGAPSGGQAQDAIVDAQAYPILTETVSTPSAPGPWGAPGAAPGGAPLGQTVQAALRDVLGWRPRGSDSKGFVSALNQSFQLKDIEGHVEWSWTPRSYAVTVADDLGAVTGAQASLYNRAKVALDQSLPLLDGLYPLTPETKPEEIDAIRAIVRSEFTQLVTELGVVGGPRAQRVDDYFIFLLGSAPVTDPENVGGHLAQLGNRLSMDRPEVNTVEDEQNLTNYLIINDYVIGLKQSWDTIRKYFDHSAGVEPFLGTQLVLVSQALTATAEAVQQAYFAMDSVFLGPAERQTMTLNFNDGSVITVPPVIGDADINSNGTFTFRNTPPLLVSELLDWVYRVTTAEAPRLIQDSGKDGVIAIFPVVNKLRKLVQGALVISAGGAQNPRTQPLPTGYGTPRVQRALAELADVLDDVSGLAGRIYVKEQRPRARLERQETLNALQDPDVIDFISGKIAAQRSRLPPTQPPPRPPQSGG